MGTATIPSDIEILVPLITYLGANPVWWARSATSLAEELGLDPVKVARAFERYPMIFRRSNYIHQAGAYSYALQMRYAHRRDGLLTAPPQICHFPVLSEQQVLSLIEFLVKMSTLEITARSARRSAMIAGVAAVFSALGAITSIRSKTDSDEKKPSRWRADASK